LPCFTAIAIRNINEIPSLLDNHMGFSKSKEPLILCILDKLCGMYEAGSDVIALIYKIIFERYHTDIALDIVKKYPHVQKLILEYCYKTINSSWNISMNRVNVYTAASIIEKYKGIWHGLKSLLIVLRKTRKELVNDGLQVDIRYLKEGNNDIVWEIESRNAWLSADSSKKLRQDMADGLSDWLKPLPQSKRADLDKRLEEYTIDEKDREGFDITYTEPDPIWRYAYVRAIADLRVDVDGKGHYIHTVMDKVAQNDPSAMVREAAGKTSTKLKNLRDGWDGDNHKKNISLAFWWIKQASRLAINLPVDRKNALRTRNTITHDKNAYREVSKSKYEETWKKLIRERLKI